MKIHLKAYESGGNQNSAEKLASMDETTAMSVLLEYFQY
jgi:hypothetical protein